MGSASALAWTLLSLSFWIGVVLLALWFFRYVKDSPENKKLLAWGLALTIGFGILVCFTFWSGEMTGRFPGAMMGDWVEDREFRNLMLEHMKEELRD
jgi:uncharacterized membrane protein